MRADGFGQSAAMSFYTLFSFAPITVFAMLIAGHFLGEKSAQKAAADWLDGFLARSEADAMVKMLTPSAFDDQGWLFALISGITLFWAATLIFVRLRISINVLLGHKSKTVRQAVKRSLMGRLVALSFTLGAGLLLIGGILLTSLAPKIVELIIPFASSRIGILIYGINAIIFFLSVAAIMRFFAVKAPSWRAILWGTSFVLVAFELGRILVNLYLERSEIASAYGAANTLVIFLLWIYYSSQMLLFGVTIAGVLDAPDTETQEG